MFRRKLIVLLLGFSSGLPLALTGGTLQAWLKGEGIDIKTIGLLNLVSLPYSYKFIWAPFVDSSRPLGMGRRRGWILITQLALIVTLLIQSTFIPSSELILFSTLSLAIAFFSATQDIAIDAYRREILPNEELGSGAALSQLGYRLGMILSSGVAMILADHFSWGAVYRIMALALSLGVVTTLLSTEPEVEGPARPSLKDYIEPFKEFLSRSKWWELLLLVLLYKLTDAFAMALTTPFLLDVGFTKTEIGSVLKVIGVAATIGGALLAGFLMEKITLKRALVVFGVAQLAANLAYAYLSIVGHDRPVFIVTVVIENFGSGLGTAAFVAFLMSITSRQFSGTQYAILTSLAALSRLGVQMPSGYLAEGLGWTNYFLLSVLLGFPAVILVYFRYDKWSINGSKAV